MASYLTCGCAPMEPDPELIDMDLEELWENQRNGRPSMRMQKGLRGRGKQKSRMRSLSKGRRRSNSRGRSLKERFGKNDDWGRDDYDEEEEERHLGFGGRRESLAKRFSGKSNTKKDNSKKVSISKYVEKIELQQRNPRAPSRRNGVTTIRAKREVSRSRGLSQNRSRSFDSAGRGNRGILLTRSRSMDSRGSRGNNVGVLRRTRSADKGARSMSRTRSKNRFDFPDYDDDSYGDDYY
jgi:hypothetical protein